MWKRGDRVVIPASGGRWTKDSHGTYWGETRDGRYDRVWIDGATKPRVINKGYIKPEPAPDPIGIPSAQE